MLSSIIFLNKHWIPLTGFTLPNFISSMNSDHLFDESYQLRRRQPDQVWWTWSARDHWRNPAAASAPWGYACCHLKPACNIIWMSSTSYKTDTQFNLINFGQFLICTLSFCSLQYSSLYGLYIWNYYDMQIGSSGCRAQLRIHQVMLMWHCNHVLNWFSTPSYNSFTTISFNVNYDAINWYRLI